MPACDRMEYFMCFGWKSKSPDLSRQKTHTKAEKRKAKNEKSPCSKCVISQYKCANKKIMLKTCGYTQSSF